MPAEAQDGDGLFVFEDRLSDSPLVERIWRSQSTRAGTFLSVATSNCEMVVTRHAGVTTLTLRGPETRATIAECPADAEWIGVRFAPGTFLPDHPTATLRDRNDVTLPTANTRSFWLKDARWEFPDFENADEFIERLVRAGVIQRDPAVGAVLEGEERALSRRSTQRHFLQATGMTYSAYKQIQRARHATNLLRQGAPIVDTVYEAGYFDQAHLTRSLRQLVGETPARIRRRERQLSLLYKTTPSR